MITNHVCNGSFNSKERNKSQEHCLDLCTTDDSFVMADTFQFFATVQIFVKFLNYGDSYCFFEIRELFYNFALIFLSTVFHILFF